MKDIKLWVKAKDVVTGFTGIVTSITSYLTGCDRVCLTPEMNKWEIKDWWAFDITSVLYLWEWVVKHFESKTPPQTNTTIKTWWPETYKSKRFY